MGDPDRLRKQLLEKLGSSVRTNVEASQGSAPYLFYKLQVLVEREPRRWAVL